MKIFIWIIVCYSLTLLLVLSPACSPTYIQYTALSPMASVRTWAESSFQQSGSIPNGIGTPFSAIIAAYVATIGIGVSAVAITMKYIQRPRVQ